MRGRARPVRRSTSSACPSSIREQLVGFLKAMEFTTLTKRIAQAARRPGSGEARPRLCRAPVRAATAARLAAATRCRSRRFRAARPRDRGGRRRARAGRSSAGERRGRPLRRSRPAGRAGQAPGARERDARQRRAARAAEARRAVRPAAYETVASLEQLDAWIARGRRGRASIAVDTETDALDPTGGPRRRLAGGRAGPGLLRPARPRRREARPRHRPVRRGRRASTGRAGARPDPARRRIARLKPLLEDPGVLKVGQNLKYDWLVLAPLRHRGRARRRHDADLLRARRRQGRPRHGRAGRAPSRPPADHVLGGRRAPAQARSRFDRVAARQGHATMRPRTPT